MATQQLSAFQTAAAAAAHEMLANATYVQRELPAIGVIERQRAAIVAACAALIGTKHDVISELAELAELTEPATSTLVQHRVERIARWLGEDMPQLNAVVELLDGARATDPRAARAYVLFAESAANVLRAIGEATAAAAEYGAAVRTSKNG